MNRIVLFLGLLLLAIPARAQYLDGLPAASAVASADIIPVCQGGTAGHPGTCTTRKATALQLNLGSLLNTNLNLGTGTLTAAGATFTGPLHMGANLIDGSNIAFTGGSFTGLSSLGVTGNATLSGTLTTGTGVTNGLLMSAATLSVTGTGNPPMVVQGLGTGGISFKTGATPLTGLQLVDGGASAVNSVRIIPGTTGNGVSIQAIGDAAAVLNLKAGTSGTAGSVKSYVPMNVAGAFSYGAATTYTAGTGLSSVPSTNPAQSYSNVTLSGSLTTGFVTPYFWSVNDNISLFTTNGAMFYFSETLGVGSDGSRSGTTNLFAKSAAAATPSTNYSYLGMGLFMHFDHGDGGTSTTPLGGVTNINPDLRCNTGDWITSCTNDEHDIRVYAGTNTPVKVNQVLHYGILDGNHASGAVGAPNQWTDADLALTASPAIGNGSGKGIVAILLGCHFCDIPWDTTPGIGTAIMGVKVNNSGNMGGSPTAYIDSGFNLPEVYVRAGGKFIDNGAFYVLGTGGVFSGNTSLVANATGQVLSTGGVVETSAVIVSGGDHALVGAEIVDSIGGVWEVATISAGAAATVTLKRASSGASCPVSPTSTRMFGAITQPTLTITCANRIGLTVQNSAGSLGFYGATPIIKATPVGACAGNTGCQALRDALGNLGFINTGSISD